MIIGGESLGARPFDLQWARDTQNVCFDLGIAFFMKQLGYYLVDKMGIEFDPKGERLENIPKDLRIREFPS